MGLWNREFRRRQPETMLASHLSPSSGEPAGAAPPPGGPAANRAPRKAPRTCAGDMRITPSATGPHELAALEALVHQHHARLIPDQNLDPVRPFRTEHEGRAAERVETKHLLHLRSEPIMATAEIDRPRRDVNPQSAPGAIIVTLAPRGSPETVARRQSPPPSAPRRRQSQSRV